MKRSLPSIPANVSKVRASPGADAAELALQQSAVLMAPVALWLLRNGVSYAAFADQLKAVFLDAARGELEQGGVVPTQSALSTLSGLHRKDVRALSEVQRTVRSQPRPPLASQVFTRWLTDRRYRGTDGKPRALPRVGARRSFESLCRELSNDVHPRTVLDELLRLGQVGLDGERVVILAASFVPQARLDEMTALFAAGTADHIAAAVSNLTADAPPFLEQSIYADGLTPVSIDLLHAAARKAWAQAFEAVVSEARARVDLDAASDGDQRMRFGVYFFSEPAPDAVAADPAPAPAADPPGPRPRNRRKP